MNKRLSILIAILILLIGLSIRMKEPEPESPQTVAPQVNRGGSAEFVRDIQILPASPTRESTLRVSSHSAFFNPSNYRYRWSVNKRDVGQEATLPLVRFHPGDIVSVEIVPEGSDGVPSATASVVIENHRPQIKTIEFTPLPIMAGQPVRAEVTAEDADQDFIRLTYEWQVNSQPVENDRETLNGDYVHSGDRILVFVTPSDLVSEGDRKVSPLLTVANRSPEIFSSPPQVDIQGQYRYAVVARDPDDDTLHYRLLESPPGMTLDAVTGVLTWAVTPLPKNQSRVSIEVDDAKGGKTTQSFTVQITTKEIPK